jgi:manganese-dependent inorganic pyrophosphatase
MFRSPTCTAVDEDACRRLAAIAGIDIENYAVSMFTAGSNLGNKTTYEIFHQDYKVFSTDGKTFGIGQISSFSNDLLSEIKPKILEYMKENYDTNNVDIMFFMLTNIFSENTELLFYGKDCSALISKAFSQDEDTLSDSIILKNVVSRKKQVIPKLMSTLHEM